MLKLLHRAGNKPISLAWPAALLAFFQRCLPTRTWKRENSRVEDSSVTKCKKVFIDVISSACYRKRTHVYGLEGYCAITSSTMLVSLNSDGRKHYVPKPFWSMVYWKDSNPVCYFASYGNRTHVNSLEGCYVTTTPMMLLNCVMEEGEQPGCIFFCNKYQRKISVNVIAFASYGNGTHVNSLEVYYATTTPMMLLNSVMEK